MITIDYNVLKDYNLTIDEFLVLLLNYKDVDILKTNELLIKKELASKDVFNNLYLVLSNNTKDFISNVIVESDKKVQNFKLDYLDLASKLREIFPEGKKNGTCYMWRDSNTIIAKKLKTLVSKFDYKFTEEQAINAAKEYVKSFNGNYTYMQLLKYFILKQDPITKEYRSDFMSYIENADQKGINNDWNTELI
jgi:hypothetical protein